MAKSLKDTLPQYSPPESVWDTIEQGLREDPLQEALTRLPTYEPPVQAWFDMVTQLPNPQNRWRRYAAAAAIVLAVGAGGHFILQNKVEKATISYSQEKLNPNANITANDILDRQYAHLQSLCQEQITVCEKPEFKTLKKELDDLTAASNQLREALGPYNTDAALSAQLSEIEQERADILRKLNKRI